MASIHEQLTALGPAAYSLSDAAKEAIREADWQRDARPNVTTQVDALEALTTDLARAISNYSMMARAPIAYHTPARPRSRKTWLSYDLHYLAARVALAAGDLYHTPANQYDTTRALAALIGDVQMLVTVARSVVLWAGWLLAEAARP